jgi:hypothetical protein
VLHDWNDHDAERILGRVAEAAGGGARVVVVDGEHTVVPRDDLAASADLLMAALTNGDASATPRPSPLWADPSA